MTVKSVAVLADASLPTAADRFMEAGSRDKKGPAAPWGSRRTRRRSEADQKTNWSCVMSVPVSFEARPSTSPVWSKLRPLYSTVSFSMSSIM